MRHHSSYRPPSTTIVDYPQHTILLCFYCDSIVILLFVCCVYVVCMLLLINSPAERELHATDSTESIESTDSTNSTDSTHHRFRSLYIYISLRDVLRFQRVCCRLFEINAPSAINLMIVTIIVTSRSHEYPRVPASLFNSIHAHAIHPFSLSNSLSLPLSFENTARRMPTAFNVV